MFDTGKMKKKVKELKKSGLIKKNEKILIAFSGGPDSVFLYNLLFFLREYYSIEISLIYVNHNLREDVKNDLNFVEEFSKENNVPLYIESVDVRKYAAENKKSIELAARELRYEAIEKVLQNLNYDKIATGHNLDDNIETFIFRLLRGTSLKGLKGIPSERKNIIRPILQFEKKEILNYLQENKKSYIIDYTNSENDYTRNYIRNEIFPMFVNINPTFRNKVNELIQEINNKERLKTYSEEKNTKEKFVQYLEKYDVELSRKKIDQIYETLYNENGDMNMNGSKEFYLGNGKILRKKYDKLEVIVEEKREVDEERVEIKQNIPIKWYDYSIILTDNILNTKSMEDFKEGNVTFLKFTEKYEDENYKIFVRKRIEGDAILLNNLGHKKLKKILIDQKIPKWERDRIPVFEMEYKKNNRNISRIIGIGDIKFSKYIKKEEVKNKSENNERLLIIGRKNGR
jgi:tRNA(ile)-lysidine synthase